MARAVAARASGRRSINPAVFRPCVSFSLWLAAYFLVFLLLACECSMLNALPFKSIGTINLYVGSIQLMEESRVSSPSEDSSDFLINLLVVESAD